MHTIDSVRFEQKMAILTMAIDIHGVTAVGNFDPNATQTQNIDSILETAAKLENFVSPITEVPTEAEKRKAFLDSLPKTTCGRGDPDCNGSESTCACG